MITRRVMHVDDESDIREVVQFALGLDPNLVTLSCASGEEALVAATAWSPDIILLDVMMPAMDGPTTLRLLRTESKLADIPVIFMTARAQSRELDVFRTLGVAGIIPKPFDPMKLAAIVHTYLRPQKMRLSAMSNEFLKRANKQLAFLVQYGFALGTSANRSSTLAEIQTIAHNLAGGGGVFGFTEISDAAASLEAAVICKRDGSGAVTEIEMKLEQLCDCITKSVSHEQAVDETNDK